MGGDLPHRNAATVEDTEGLPDELTLKENWTIPSTGRGWGDTTLRV